MVAVLAGGCILPVCTAWSPEQFCKVVPEVGWCWDEVSAACLGWLGFQAG
jgi:hypothetical protein